MRGVSRVSCNRRHLLHPPTDGKKWDGRCQMSDGAAAGWARERGGRIRRYSITMQHGRCWEKYLKSSGVAPGQLVSSNSSSSCS